MPSSSPAPQPEQVAAFFQKHRTGLVTLVFTDLVDSTALLQKLGDQTGATFLQNRRDIVRELLSSYDGGEEIETAGDSFLLLFAKPSDAVRFALTVNTRFRDFSAKAGVPLQERMGIHLGEVVIREGETEGKTKDLYGIQLTTASRVMSLAEGGQILLTHAVFDSARQVLKGEEIPDIGELSWVSHGPYSLKGIDEPVDVCEVGEQKERAFEAPKTSGKAQRQVRPDEEPVLGWRPAVGQEVPNTPWVLEEKLGEGGFGEVWRARHNRTKEDRVFKFCFRANRVRTLKRELTLFRVLREHVGEHPNIVRLHNVYLDEPPFYLEEDYVDGKDLATWCKQQGGLESIPLKTKLEIVAQAADALQAAHDAGIIHRDVKPGNILVSGKAVDPKSVRVKLTDFGIGQVMSTEVLAGVTRGGFTETILSSSSSSKTGTQLYMAPELMAGKAASTRSDTYSLGVVLYQLAVADFRRPVVTDWAKAIADPLLREDLQSCFAGNPNDRFASTGELARQLRSSGQRVEAVRARELMERQATQRRRVVLMLASVTTLLLLLAIALGYGLRQARIAEASETRLRQRAQFHAYASDMKLAQEALAQDNLGLARELLDRHLPKVGQTDMRGWEWRYLWDQCRGSPSRTVGAKPHSSVELEALSATLAVSSLIAVSPDGKWAVMEEQHGTISIWDLSTAHAIARVEDTSWLVRAAFSPMQPLLAYSCTENEGSTNQHYSVRLWDFTAQEAIGSLPLTGRCAGLAFSGDGRTLVTCTATHDVGGESEIAIWEVGERRKVTNYPIPPAARESYWQPFAVTPDLSVVAYSYGAYAGAPESTISLMDLATGENRWTVDCTDLGFSALALSPNGEILAAASGNAESRVRLISVATGKDIGQLESHRVSVASLLFWPDGTKIVSGDYDNTIRVWDIATSRLLGTLQANSTISKPLALLPDNVTLVSGVKDGLVRLWDTRILTARRAPYQVITNVSLDWRFTEDSTAVVAVDRDGAIIRRQRPGLQEVHPEFDLGERGKNVSLSRYGNLVAVGSDSGLVEVWDVGGHELLHRLDFPPGTAKVLDFLAGQKGLITIREEGRPTEVRRANRFVEWSKLALVYPEEALVREWDLTTGEVIRTWLSRWPPDTFGTAQSQDGRWFLAIGLGGSVWLGDRLTGQEKMHKLAINGANDVVFSPNGTLFATSGWTGVTKVWDTVTLREVASIPAWGVSVAFAPDGDRLAVGNTGKRAITLWDIESQQQVLVLGGEGSNFWKTQFSPDGNVLGSLNMNREGALHIWRAPSWAEIEAAERERAALQAQASSQ